MLSVFSNDIIFVNVLNELHMIELIMISQTEDSTVSMLTSMGKYVCFVVEDGHRDIKEYGETRIDGDQLVLRKRKHGGFYEKYKSKYGHSHVWEIIGLNRHTDVLVHIGNTVKDTLGCLLTNFGVKYDTDKELFAGIDSAKAYLSFYDEMEKYDSDEVPFNIIRTNFI